MSVEEDLLRTLVDSQRHELDMLHRQVDDLMFFHRLADQAEVDTVLFTGPPPQYQPNPTAQGAGNEIILQAYVFVPKGLDRSRKHPLLVHPHGGVHSNYTSNTVNVLREVLAQGYTVIAPEYRGSTGYGKAFFELIDYGGLETEDTFRARQFALDTYPFLDESRVGLMGWSHGGLHTLFNIFDHPEAYAAAYVCAPVSDLVARMGYKSQTYRDQMSAPFHVGKTVEENVAEYRRRSPSWQVDRYQGTPLLIHSNTNDEDVNVLEVERLIQALQAAGKAGTVQHKIWEAAPGGHRFNRIDTPLARESRAEAWRFLAEHLHPEHPPE